MDIQKLHAPPAYQAIFDALQRFIVSGELNPGDPLPTETELADRFGVNRSTVREGIRQLQSEGLVAREGRKRLVVTVPEAGDLAPRLTRAMVMNQVSFQELLDVAMVLEPLAAGEAAETATDEDIARLTQNIDEMEGEIAAGKSQADLDMSFHTMLAEITRNRVLLLSREPVGLLLYSSFETIIPRLPQAAARNVAAHREVVGHIARRDAEGARRWMERHLRDLSVGWQMAGQSADRRIDPAVTF